MIHFSFFRWLGPFSISLTIVLLLFITRWITWMSSTHKHQTLAERPSSLAERPTSNRPPGQFSQRFHFEGFKDMSPGSGKAKVAPATFEWVALYVYI